MNIVVAGKKQKDMSALNDNLMSEFQWAVFSMSKCESDGRPEAEQDEETMDKKNKSLYWPLTLTQPVAWMTFSTLQNIK